jgi:uncharacterized membrane protein YkvA (DUF1232 family)
VRTLLIALAAILVVYVAAIASLALAGRRAAAREVVAFLPNLVSLFRGLLRDPRVPRTSKALLALGAVWIASPIDLIPEFVPVLGPLDDAVIAGLILRRVLKTAGADVVTEHLRGDPATLERLLRLFAVRSREPTQDASPSRSQHPE